MIKRITLALLPVLGLAGCSAAGEETAVYLGLPWWLVLLIAALLIGGFLWWLYSGRRARPLPPPGMPPDPVGPKALDVHDSEVIETAHDDLTRIQGIGPQTARVLGGADIHTYARLADTPVAELERLLDQADLLGTDLDPQSWPAQATLAAAGKWEDLAAMQARLAEERHL